MIVAFQSICAERIQFAEVDSPAIKTRFYFNASRIWKIIGAARHDNSSRWNIKAAFDDFVPRVENLVGRGILHLNCDWNIRITNRSDADCPRSQSYSIFYGYIRPALRQIALSVFILKIKLEVVGEEVELVSGHELDFIS